MAPMTSSNTKAKPSLSTREWTPKAVDDLVQTYAGQTALQSSAAINTRIEELARRHRQIHDLECFNLNPASNIMNPVAEKMLASGLSTKPSLGYPGDKYEMGLDVTEVL